MAPNGRDGLQGHRVLVAGAARGIGGAHDVRGHEYGDVTTPEARP